MAWCPECRHTTETKDKYCSQCGTSLTGKLPTIKEQEEHWDYCEVDYEEREDTVQTFFRKQQTIYRMRFLAKVTNPTGSYALAKSPEFFHDKPTGPDNRKSEHLEALASLLHYITILGWERMPLREGAWYGYKFRRLVKHPIQKQTS
jgi:hypothetical protein